MAENVNHPNHYQNGGIETIDYIKSVLGTGGFDAEEGAYFFQVIKYASRAKRKNGVEDLEKCKWYLDEWIKHLRKKEVTF